MIAGHPSRVLLVRFVEGQLPAQQREPIEQHVTGCSTCAQVLESLRAAADTSGGTSTPESRSDGPSSGPAPAAAAPNVPPDLAEHSRYRIVRLLGQGGMGAVYQAEHRVMARMVALKVIRKSLTDSANAVERFRREIRAAARLTHPNIVTAYDAEEAGELQFLVTEYVEGLNLTQWLERRGTLPAATACQYICQAAAGLQHAHEAGMVHRDLKPQNLMLTSRGVVKILDFGLARFVSEAGDRAGGLTQDSVMMGTPDYIAPEQAMDARAADIRADIYSLGCTLFTLLTGQPPFPGGTTMQKLTAHMHQQPRRLGDVVAGIPAELEAIVARMMAKDPGQRFQVPADVVQALAPFTGAAVPAASLPSAEGAQAQAPASGPSTGAQSSVWSQATRAPVAVPDHTRVLAEVVPRKSPASLRLPLILAGAGSGLVVLLVCAGLLGWLIVRAGKSESTVKATDEPGKDIPREVATEVAPPEPVPVLIKPPVLESDRVVRNLLDAASDVCVGGGGRYLILQLPKQKKLAIFDVNEAAVVRYIPLSEDQILYAAGLEKLVIGLATKGTLERWDLATGEKEVARNLAMPGPIVSVLMGNASQGPVVVNGSYLDLETFKPLPIVAPGGTPGGTRTPASGDGTVFAAWNTNLSPASSATFVLQGNNVNRYEGGEQGHVVPGPDGRTVYTAKGVRTNQFQAVPGTLAKHEYCLPAVHDSYYVSITPADAASKGGLTVYMLGNESPLLKDANFGHGISFDGWDREGFGPWKRIYFVPRAKVIIVFPPSNDRLELRRFDVEQALEKSGIDYLLLTSHPPTKAKRGTELMYAVTVKSKRGGVKYTMSSGPKGMAISPDGLLSWKVPADYKGAEADVILTIRDVSQQELFHAFKVRLID